MAEVLEDDTLVDRCPSCRAQALAVAAAHMHGLIVTFVVIGGARLPWTVIVRKDTNIQAVASGHTQEDALHDVLRQIGVIE